jgi:hypothetical protein
MKHLPIMASWFILGGVSIIGLMVRYHYKSQTFESWAMENKMKPKKRDAMSILQHWVEENISRKKNKDIKGMKGENPTQETLNAVMEVVEFVKKLII